jgi:hypothetical protein
MENKKYKIKYEIHLNGSTVIRDKEIKIDKCMSEVHAQVRLEDYLKRKYINFEKLVVTGPVTEVKFDDIFGSFSDIFGNSNNFFYGKNH